MAKEVSMSLDDRMDKWVEAELLTAEQAGAIRRFETSNAPRGTGRDVLAYLGAVLILAAALVVASEVWPDLDSWGHAIVAGIAAVVLTLIGESLARSGQPATARVGTASLLLGTVTVGIAVEAIFGGMGVDTRYSVLIGFLGALAYAIVFYQRRKTTAQQAAVFGAAFGAVMTLVAETLQIDGGIAPGVVAALFGVAWMAAATTGNVQPRLVGEVLGMAAVFLGSFLLIMELDPTDLAGRIAMLAAIAMAAVLVSIGVLIDRTTYIVGGVLMLVVYLPWLITEVLGGGLGAPFALLAGGGLLVATAVYLNRRASRG